MGILVTGGAGYIGSHTVVELLEEGQDVVVIDNFTNSSQVALERVQQITGKGLRHYEGDVRDARLLDTIFTENDIDAVIHFASLKAVDASITDPLTYYDVNIGCTVALCQAMQRHDVKKLLFSSSATVYGIPEKLPVTETALVGNGITNPYGQTKNMIEQILRDLTNADHSWAITMLRYFNPIGAHESGLIGEDPHDAPNNLMPYISQVAVGRREYLRIFGNTYDTPDGTGVRDYVHVVDLARGHLAALQHLRPARKPQVYNLGTGKGTSVLELVKAFEQASGVTIPCKIVARRGGDVARCYADVSKARRMLGWQAKKTLLEACEDGWRWQSANPDGYLGSSLWYTADNMKRGDMNKDVCIIIPVYNEQTVIAETIQNVLRSFPFVVCVNDGSRDNSAAEIARTGAILVDHPINMGQGAALQTGIDFALQYPDINYFVTFDADGQHGLDDVQKMLAHIRSHTDVDVVLGSRFLGEAENISLLRKVMLRMAVIFSNVTTGLQLTDAHNGLRVFNRQVAEQLDITMPDMAHASEIIHRIAEKEFAYTELPITIAYTDYSKAKGQSMMNAFNISFDILLQRLTKK